MRIRLNAFDKDSSANYSELIGVKTTTECLMEIERFEKKVPFGRFYREDEILECDAGQDENLWEKFLEDN